MGLDAYIRRRFGPLPGKDRYPTETVDCVQAALDLAAYNNISLRDALIAIVTYDRRVVEAERERDEARMALKRVEKLHGKARSE